MFNVYSLLDLIRAKPGMYLGVPSLTRLVHFLHGYHFALIEHNIPFEKVGIWRPLTRELPDFHTFVSVQLGETVSTEGYANCILWLTQGDERGALELFWTLLDEYKRQENALTLRSPASNNEG